MACRILVSHLGMESWHWKQQVLTTGQPWNSQKTSSCYRRYTSPNLFSDLCSHHSPFSPSTPTTPAFILLPEYIPLISTHRAFAVPIVMDSFAVYLCVAASFLSDLVSSSQKKKKKFFSVSLFMPWPVSPEPLPNWQLWCLPERTYGCWNGLVCVCVFSCPASNSQIRPQPL